jgi:hypothetical protein
MAKTLFPGCVDSSMGSSTLWSESERDGSSDEASTGPHTVDPHWAVAVVTAAIEVAEEVSVQQLRVQHTRRIFR